MSEERPLLSPPLRQLALQAAAAILILSLAWPYYLVVQVPLDWEATAYLIGIAAFALATWGRLSWWWRLIHLMFAPAAMLVARLDIEPLWFLAIFLVLLATFRGVVSGQIPLYLSGAAARREILLLARERGVREVLDLGAGTGSLIVPLAREAPEIRWVGVENSPIPWAIARLRAAFLPNCEIRYESLWQTELSRAGLVYAFLSPAPMRRLWQKASSEMAADACLVSNSFPVPDAEVSEIIDADGYLLYRYDLPAGGNSAP